MYTLAGLANSDTGWGLTGETFHVLESLERLGVPTWFKLGDMDMATHIRRTQLLLEGRSLSDATRELCERLGVRHAVLPMSDAPVRTVALTDDGELAFQEYFVHQQSAPRIQGVEFRGAEQAEMSPELKNAFANAECIIFCPSNPIVSIGPILAVPGALEALQSFEGPRIAVSPIVGGQALKGPAAKMMAELGEEVSCVGVARRLRDICDVLVIDEVDREQSKGIEALGVRVVVTGTVMTTDADKERLAREVLAAAKAARVTT
jgi:LPPG:FO 2-phospho-L-lactate transferase